MKSKIFALSISLMTSAVASAQLMPSTAYFMDKNPLIHTLNPSFHPMEKFYFSIPGMSLMKFDIGWKNLTFEDVMKPMMIDGKNTTVTFLHPSWIDGRQQFLDNMKHGWTINSDVNVQLLSFGFRVKPKSYITLGVNTRADVQVHLPKNFWQATIGGGIHGEQTVQSFGLNDMFIGANAFTEFALGYTYDMNDKWSFGAKFKYLYGHGAVKTEFKDVNLSMSKDEWKLTGDANVYASAPGVKIVTDDNGAVNDFDFDIDSEDKDIKDQIKDLARASGKGVAVDLGATYKFRDNLRFSASVLDLGGMKYKRNVHAFSKDGDFVFDGLEYDINDDKDFDEYFDKYEDMLENMYYVDSTASSFGYRMAPKLLIGAEYGVWDNRTTFGFLSKTKFDYARVSEDLMLSVNFKPVRIFSMSVSYSLMDGHWSNLGAGVNVNFGALNWFLILDQIPLRLAKGESIYIPTRLEYLNFAMGCNFAVRAEEDKHLRRKAREAARAAKQAEEFPAAVDTAAVVAEPVKEEVKVEPTPVAEPAKEEIKVEPTPVVEQAKEEVKVEPTPVAESVKEEVKVEPTPVAEPVKEEVKDDEAKLMDGELIKEALYGIKFSNKKNEMVLLPSSYPILNKIADRMSVNPSFKLEIRGHYFMEDDSPRNRFFGRERASLVKWYLVEKGVKPTMIDINGVGDSYPIEPNETPEQKKKNTRMELRLFR